jgi:hypothetical protein
MATLDLLIFPHNECEDMFNWAHSPPPKMPQQK